MLDEGRGAIQGQKVGNFLVRYGFSEEYINREFNKILSGVMDRYNLYLDMFGDTNFMIECFKSEPSNYKKQYIKACAIVREMFGEDVKTMRGRPSYFGDTNIYFHFGDWTPDELDVHTRNRVYGHFYFPIAIFTGKKLLIVNTHGLNISREGLYDYVSYNYDLLEEVTL